MVSCVSAGCDLDVWTFEQLRKIVGDFKKSKQKESPVFDLTGSNNNGIYEFDQLQSPTTGSSDSRSFAAPDLNVAQTAKFMETKQQILSNKNQQMKHDLDDIFADLDALKVKKVNDLFNLGGMSQAKPQTSQFSDFEINDKGEIVLLTESLIQETANSPANDKALPKTGKLAEPSKKQAVDGAKKPERRKREEPTPKDAAPESAEESADGSPRVAVEVVK